jgi:hypothetical protein
MPTLSLHAEAVNLARRYSVQNENDLLQVRDTVEEVFITSCHNSRRFRYRHGVCNCIFVTSVKLTDSCAFLVVFALLVGNLRW